MGIKVNSSSIFQNSSFKIPFLRFYAFAVKKSKQIKMEKVKLTVNNNGSLKIDGDFEIVDRNGNVYDLGGRTILGICRCGLSKNKPFCDGAHNGHFEHEAVAFALPPKK